MPTTHYVDASSTTGFSTIQQASSIACPGDTICVLPGIYRERVVPCCDAVTYIGVPDEKTGAKPIVRGSVQWTPTMCVSAADAVYAGSLDTVCFPDTSHKDGANPFAVPFCVTPYRKNGLPESKTGEQHVPLPDPGIAYCLGGVFGLDSMEFVQQGCYTDMVATPGSWFYDPVKNTLYVHYPTPDSPNNDSTPKPVEIVNQRRLFAPHKRGLKNVVVDGFVFERCGNQYPNQFWVAENCQQAGAIGTRSGKSWTIRNCVIQYASGIGIDWGNEGSSGQDLEIGTNGLAQNSGGHTITDCMIRDNGAAGTAAYMAKNVVFSGNTVERNNRLQFYGKRRWESAGVKVHCPTGCTFRSNVIRDNVCHGMWCDQGPGIGSQIVGNRFASNQGAGIDFEIGKQASGLVADNTFVDNETGITFTTSGGVLIKNNVFESSRKVDIETILFTRTADKWDSDNLRIYSNQFGSLTPMYLALTAPDAQIPSNRYLRGNRYPCDGKFSIIQKKTSTVYSFADWCAYWNTVYPGGADNEAESSVATFM